MQTYLPDQQWAPEVRCLGGLSEGSQREDVLHATGSGFIALVLLELVALATVALGVVHADDSRLHEVAVNDSNARM